MAKAILHGAVVLCILFAGLSCAENPRTDALLKFPFPGHPETGLQEIARDRNASLLRIGVFRDLLEYKLSSGKRPTIIGMCMWSSDIMQQIARKRGFSCFLLVDLPETYCPEGWEPCDDPVTGQYGLLLMTNDPTINPGELVGRFASPAVTKAVVERAAEGREKCKEMADNFTGKISDNYDEWNSDEEIPKTEKEWQAFQQKEGIGERDLAALKMQIRELKPHEMKIHEFYQKGTPYDTVLIYQYMEVLRRHLEKLETNLNPETDSK